MQMISPTLLDAEEYAAEQAHRHIKRPSQCPQCKEPRTLRALGFYSRSVTSPATGDVVTIKVRRFLCGHCRRSLSILPSFAQPYRLICSFTIERFFNKSSVGRDTLQWHGLLRRYWRRFNSWIPELVAIVGRAFGLPPPTHVDQSSWRAVFEAYGHLDQATRKLVKLYRVTLFGRYQCHSPVVPSG